jgi:hypothetical protein
MIKALFKFFESSLPKRWPQQPMLMGAIDATVSIPLPFKLNLPGVMT